MIEAGLAPGDDAAVLEKVASEFRIRMTPAMQAAARPGTPADPIAAQFVPDARELDTRPEELLDPIGDDATCQPKMRHHAAWMAPCPHRSGCPPHPLRRK